MDCYQSIFDQRGKNIHICVERLVKIKLIGQRGNVMSIYTQNDYQNDWIERCSSIKQLNYKSLNNKQIYVVTDKNEQKYNVFVNIIYEIEKKHHIYTQVKKYDNIVINDEKAVILIWDLSNSSLCDEKLSLIRKSVCDKVFISDKILCTEKYKNGDEKIFGIYSPNLYGAGYSQSKLQINDNFSTNILDFFASQLYLIEKADALYCDNYYCGHGDCLLYKHLSNVGYETMISFIDGEYMLDFSQNNPDQRFYFGNTYYGKLLLLQNLLFMILREFDRICKKNNIKYFLGGGTLLGAIRHQGFIPWDDDIDVMMLRSEYNKFLTIVESNLSDKMFFQSSKTDCSYHSVFTKIRLNGTKFVSRFSATVPNMKQGIFIDIFVHDKTSNLVLMQKFHVFKTLVARSMVFHKWSHTPMKFNGKLKLICKLFTRYINKSSFNKLEKYQNKVICKYEKSNSNFLYDGTGEHLRQGAFPSSWLDGDRYSLFNGMLFPVPIEAEKYLEYLYGDYQKLIPASQRKAKHDIVDINFGNYEQTTIR